MKVWVLVTTGESGIDGIQVFTDRAQFESALLSFLNDVLSPFVVDQDTTSLETMVDLWYDVRSELFVDYDVLEQEITV